MSETPRTDDETRYHEQARSDANALASGMTMFARQLEQENAELRKALERIGSMEAFTIGGARDLSHPEAQEMNARIDFARAVLGGTPWKAAQEAVRKKHERDLYAALSRADEPEER